MLRPRLLVLALPLLACKPAPSSPPLTALPPPPAADPVAAPPQALPPPPVAIYGFVRLPSPVGALAQLRALLPTAQGSMLDESLFRSLLGMALGTRSALAEHVSLTRPMGCIITSPTRNDRPFACVVGYAGGFTSLVQDLGPDGYVSGADEFANYRIDGQPVFLTAMGDHVAFAFAPDLVAATREQLQREIIDAPVGEKELVGTAYPSVIFADAHEEIEGMLAMIERAQPPGAYAEAATEAQRRQWLSWADLERMDLWLDLSEQRARVGYRGTALADTATATAYASAAALGPSRELVERLPASAVIVGGMSLDMSTLAADPMLGAYLHAIGSLGGSEANETLAQQYRETLALWSEQSTGQAAMALLHEPSTKGGVVIAYQMKPGVDAMPRLREIFERYREPSGISRHYSMKLRPGAFRAGKIRGDLLTMKPTAELMGQPGGAALTRVLGDPPRLDMAYAQRGEVLYMAMVPGDGVERYLRRALGAATNKGHLGARKDTRSLLDEHPRDSWVFAADVDALVAWLVAIDVIQPPRLTFGGHLDDVVMTMGPGAERQREAQLDLSTTLVRRLFELAM